jgi:hypothetical protein
MSRQAVSDLSKLPVRQKALRQKHCYVGAPAIFKLEQACLLLNHAWNHLDSCGCYLVGSCLERSDWRDVDVCMIMPDEAFVREFPDVQSIDHAIWEHDAKLLLLTVAISDWLKAQTGLPIDFKFQPQSFANARHNNSRHPVGMRYQAKRLQK